MKFHEKEENRIDQRLRHIETQLHHLTVMLENSGMLVPDDETFLREVLKEFDAEREAIQISLASGDAANDQHWSSETP